MAAGTPPITIGAELGRFKALNTIPGMRDFPYQKYFIGQTANRLRTVYNFFYRANAKKIPPFPHLCWILRLFEFLDHTGSTEMAFHLLPPADPERLQNVR